MAGKTTIGNGHSPQGNRRPLQGNWKENRDAGEPVVWSSVNGAKLQLAVDTISRAGGAIMLGRTSDGGAYSCVVLYGSYKVKEYPHSTEEMDDLLDWLVEEFLPAV